MDQGVRVITILAWFLALYISIAKRRLINFRQFMIIGICMGAGLPIGMVLFRTFDMVLLKKILAIFIIITSLWQLVSSTLFKQRETNLFSVSIKTLSSYAILIVGGIIHGMFSSGGPLVVIYASRTLHNKGEFRATLCLLWTILNTIIIITYLIEGSISQEIAVNAGILLPVVILGIVAGEKIHHKPDRKGFSVLVFSILLLTGWFMLLL
jgi:uncharacterized membrane protein YfcA